MIFFCQVKLRRTDVTIEKLTKVVNMPDMKDFIKCYESQKVAYMCSLEDSYTNINNIVFEVLKVLELHKFTSIFEAAIDIAKHLFTEYVNLSFMNERTQPKHHQIRDYICCALALLISLDLSGRSLSLTNMIAHLGKHKPLVKQYL